MSRDNQEAEGTGIKATAISPPQSRSSSTFSSGDILNFPFQATQWILQLVVYSKQSGEKSNTKKRLGGYHPAQMSPAIYASALQLITGL
jgi:hypothetical protein